MPWSTNSVAVDRGDIRPALTTAFLFVYLALLRMSALVRITSLAGLLSIASFANAWNDHGHMLSAAIGQTAPCFRKGN